MLSGSAEPDPDLAVVPAVGLQLDVTEGPRDPPLWDPLGPELAVPRAPVVSVPFPPFPAGEPLPSVPAPPEGWLPVRLLLTWTIAWRSGGTASVMAAMKATPASTATGRSQAPPGAPLARGWDSERGRDSERSRGGDQDQCPRHTQDRARVTAPETTLTSHGCGWCFAVLARIRSSPSAAGSTASTAADSCRRSASPRSRSGTVIPSPACLPGTACPPGFRLPAES